MELVRRVGDPTSKRVFVRLLAPFAPHLAEELWHQLGEPFSVHTNRGHKIRRTRPDVSRHESDARG